MSKKDYKWKRFWCPRSGSINLADAGYLPEPSSDWGRACNPELVSFVEIVDLPCLVFLGEAGMGKTTAMEVAHKQIYEQTKDSEDVCLPLFRLGDYGSDTELCNAIFRNNAFQSWLSGTHNLHLFLDSLDEGLLSIKILVRILKREIERLPCDRLYFRLTCRTAEWALSLEEKLIEKWGEDNVKVYTLAPLCRQDVIEAANKSNITDVNNFLQAISDRNAVPFAIKPITLKFLIGIYSKEGKLPSSQVELYEKGCLQLCEEVNPDRCEAGEKGKLFSKRRMLIAGRIAAVMMFCRRSAVWTSPEYGNMRDSDILIQGLCVGKEKADDQEFDVSEDDIQEVFKVTGLFSGQACNRRIGFSHRTYAEFLAAWYLAQHNLNLPQILSLILHPDGRVVPQLQETTAWLASMRSHVFQKIMETDPDVLLQSDLTSTSEADKVALVETLLNLHDQEKLSYNYHSTWLYKKLQHSTLPEQLRGFICDCHKSINARNTAIDIAEICNLADLSISLSDIACNIEDLDQVRLNAAIAVCEIDDEAAKAKLKPLAMLKSRSDLEDELKGCGLRAVWPKHMTTEEVFNNLCRPQSRMIGGRYQDFVAQELGQGILERDLPIALNWLEQQPTRRNLRYPFNALSDAIILKVWEHLENPEILLGFARLALVRLRQYDELIDANEISFKQLLEENDFKRRQFLDAVISIIPEAEKEPLWLAGYSEYSQLTPLKQDFFWLIEKLQTSGFDHTQRIYSKLIRWKLDWHSADQVSAVLTASQNNPILRAEFTVELEPVLLNSPKAEQARVEYIKRQKKLIFKDKQKVLDPSPKERILTCLNQFEAGSVGAWCHLCREMTLLPTSAHYNERFEADITMLPGWQEADETTKLRIIVAAKEYICQGEPETDAWLGTNSFRHSALAGYKALRLISVTDPNFISTISVEVWQKWAAIILDFPNAREDQNKEIRQKLIERAYQNAPDELIRALIILIEQENTQHGSIHILHEIRCCWDERLAEVLLNKVHDRKLKARSTGDLLKELLVHRVDRAKTFAESLISFPPPTDGEARAKAIVAAQMLMLYSEDAGWSVVWSAIQQDPKFGREVLESVSYAVKYQGNIEQRLKEDCVADLYIFLAQQYPTLDEQQKDSDNAELTGVEAYVVGPEDSIRTWKDYIPRRLQELGTQEACDALRKIIHELPELKDKLQWRLLEAKNLVRRKTWQPPAPEEFLQFAISQEPSNLDLSDQLNVIEKRTKKMEDEPKIENKITISNSPNSPINAPVGTSGVINSHVTLASSDTKKGVNWGNWLAGIGILVTIVAIPLSMSVSGAFNEEFKEWFNRIFPSKVEHQPAPKSE